MGEGEGDGDSESEGEGEDDGGGDSEGEGGERQGVPWASVGVAGWDGDVSVLPVGVSIPSEAVAPTVAGGVPHAATVAAAAAAAAAARCLPMLRNTSETPCTLHVTERVIPLASSDSFTTWRQVDRMGWWVGRTVVAVGR